jgi:hypothetical protein
MKISNIKIYDMMESIVASGLPMMAEYDETWIADEIENLATYENIKENPHFKRACKLAANPAGSGHCNFLSGITVSMNVTATNVWWMQLERYHFVQIVSSQSKMHRLRQMVDGNNKTDARSCFHEKTPLAAIADFETDAYEMDDFETLVYSCPMGLELTARITTNYLQLRTMYHQRKAHKLSEWHTFCDWVRSLPFAAEFITGKEN